MQQNLRASDREGLAPDRPRIASSFQRVKIRAQVLSASVVVMPPRLNNSTDSHQPDLLLVKKTVEGRYVVAHDRLPPLDLRL